MYSPATVHQGGVASVTGSCHQVMMDSYIGVLLDCGTDLDSIGPIILKDASLHQFGDNNDSVERYLSIVWARKIDVAFHHHEALRSEASNSEHPGLDNAALPDNWRKLPIVPDRPAPQGSWFVVHGRG